MAKAKVPQSWRESAYRSYVKQQNINRYRYGYDKSGNFVVTGTSDTRNVSSNVGLTLFFRVLTIFLVILVGVNLFRTLQGSSNGLSFTSLLNWLSNDFEAIEINVDISSFGISQSWGPFDGLRIFLDKLGQMFGAFVWLGANMINVVLFLAQFVSFLFA